MRFPAPRLAIGKDRNAEAFEHTLQQGSYMREELSVMLFLSGALRYGVKREGRVAGGDGGAIIRHMQIRLLGGRPDAKGNLHTLGPCSVRVAVVQHHFEMVGRRRG